MINSVFLRMMAKTALNADIYLAGIMSLVYLIWIDVF